MADSKAHRLLARKPSWPSGRFVALFTVPGLVLTVAFSVRGWWRSWMWIAGLVALCLALASAVLVLLLRGVDDDAKRDADRALFAKFVEALPSTGDFMCLIQNHPWGESFSLDSFVECDRFVGSGTTQNSNFMTRT